ncbi:MAG TPA: hypothetical protein VGO89_00135 [Streptomyces sp.]|nr:hypothetical protein [Streptomyces sp.]
MTLTTETAEAVDRTARDGRPAARWAVLAAHIVPLATLPSGLWRVGLALGFSMGLTVDGAPAHVEGLEAVNIVLLSVVCELLALLTLGLVRPWGERVPRWIPLLGGRRVHPMAAVVPAVTGAVLLQAIWAYAFRNFPSLNGFGFAGGLSHSVLVACYLPLLLWAPLLAAVTYAYYRRRCRD